MSIELLGVALEVKKTSLILAGMRLEEYSRLGEYEVRPGDSFRLIDTAKDGDTAENFDTVVECDTVVESELAEDGDNEREVNRFKGLFRAVGKTRRSRKKSHRFGSLRFGYHKVDSREITKTTTKNMYDYSLMARSSVELIRGKATVRIEICLYAASSSRSSGTCFEIGHW